MISAHWTERPTTLGALRAAGYRTRSVKTEIRENLIVKQYYHIGFAADTPNGLVVPVVKDADKKGVAQIAQEMGELSAQARDGKLKPADMQGASFTISSLGGIGGTAFTPIINAPEVAILGVSRGGFEPVWNSSAVETACGWRSSDLGVIRISGLR